MNALQLITNPEKQKHTVERCTRTSHRQLTNSESTLYNEPPNIENTFILTLTITFSAVMNANANANAIPLNSANHQRTHTCLPNPQSPNPKPKFETPSKTQKVPTASPGLEPRTLNPSLSLSLGLGLGLLRHPPRYPDTQTPRHTDRQAMRPRYAQASPGSDVYTRNQ